MWLYYLSGQPAGLAFKQTRQEKILEVHRSTSDLTDLDADSLVKLAVDSGMKGPLIIEGNDVFVRKITEAARRLNVPVHGDLMPIAPTPYIPNDDESSVDRPRMG